MLELLAMLNQYLKEKIDHRWDRFQSKEFDYLKDPNVTLPP
jgi:hypothetical protein